MMRWTCSIAVFAACIASIASLRTESRPRAQPAEPAACALALACVLAPPPVTPWVLAAWALDPACGRTQQRTIVAVGFLPTARNFLYASGMSPTGRRCCPRAPLVFLQRPQRGHVVRRADLLVSAAPCPTPSVRSSKVRFSCLLHSVPTFLSMLYIYFVSSLMLNAIFNTRHVSWS
jgi:hypothetical protein